MLTSVDMMANATSEGFNGVIQALQYAARAFRSFANDRPRLRLLCGRLDLTPNVP